MSTMIEFVNNYHDLSNENGFQFEFCCNRCGTGYRTEFKTSATGALTSALGAANSIFGGFFGTAAEIGDRVKSAGWKRARDAAFAEAAAEIRPQFAQCPRCSTWVCRKSCWNEKKGLCKHCAPDLGVEMAAAQAGKSVEEIWAHAAMAEEDKKLGTEVWREGIRATCPQCQAPLAQNAKFCPECGAKIASDRCKKCNAKIAPNAKFCPECGEKQ
ncbi:MAG TPA: zinc ribbon domain-containing protein [Bacteroidota bacterium]